MSAKSLSVALREVIQHIDTKIWYSRVDSRIVPDSVAYRYAIVYNIARYNVKEHTDLACSIVVTYKQHHVVDLDGEEVVATSIADVKYSPTEHLIIKGVDYSSSKMGYERSIHTVRSILFKLRERHIKVPEIEPTLYIADEHRLAYSSKTDVTTIIANITDGSYLGQIVFKVDGKLSYSKHLVYTRKWVITRYIGYKEVLRGLFNKWLSSHAIARRRIVDGTTRYKY